MTALRVAFLVLCLCLNGCSPITSIKRLGNGYLEVTYIRQNLSEPESHQITLQYESPTGGYTMIWPAIHGHVVNDHDVLFVAERASGKRDPDNRLVVESRLFAARAPEHVLDITDEVILQWSKQLGKDSSNLLKTAQIAFFEERADEVQFHFARGVTEDLNIGLKWEQLREVMENVRQHGVLHEDPKWKVSYVASQ